MSELQSMSMMQAPTTATAHNMRNNRKNHSLMASGAPLPQSSVTQTVVNDHFYRED